MPMKEIEITLGRGISDISFGMSEAELISIFDENYERREHPSPNDDSTKTISIITNDLTVDFNEDGVLSFIAIGKEKKLVKLWGEYIFSIINEGDAPIERTKELLSNRSLGFEVVSDSFGDIVVASRAGVAFCFHATSGTLDGIQLTKPKHNQSLQATGAGPAA